MQRCKYIVFVFGVSQAVPERVGQYFLRLDSQWTMGLAVSAFLWVLWVSPAFAGAPVSTGSALAPSVLPLWLRLFYAPAFLWTTGLLVIAAGSCVYSLCPLAACAAIVAVLVSRLCLSVGALGFSCMRGTTGSALSPHVLSLCQCLCHVP